MRAEKWLRVGIAATAGVVVLGPLQADRGDAEIAFGGRTVDAMIAEFMRENNVPGLAVAIVQAPYITRVEGFGVADAARRTLVATNTAFDVGPMRNAFTAVAIMQLVEAGKLALDGGLEGGASVRSMLRDPAAYPQLETLVATASGQSYEDFVRAGQIERLGLRHTFFAGEAGNVAREDFPAGGRHGRFLHEAGLINPTEPATGYRADAGKLTVVASPPRALFSTAHDVSVWDVGLAGDILIKDAALRRVLYHPEKGAATTGPWVFPGHEGLMVSAGTRDGFSALLSRFTRADELVCVTLLANREGLDLSQLARRIAGAYNAKLGPPPGTETMRVQQSPHSVKETIDRLDAALRARGVGIIARVDHARAAESAKLTLRPTEELIFGNPAMGTQLMQANPAITVDLPLRAAAWEENGEVWVAATDPVELAERHGLTDLAELAQKMRAGVDAVLAEAVAPGQRAAD